MLESIEMSESRRSVCIVSHPDCVEHFLLEMLAVWPLTTLNLSGSGMEERYATRFTHCPKKVI